MRIAEDAKDDKCKRNAHLQELSQESCAKQFAARDLKYQKGKNVNVRQASKPRHTVCKENDKQNLCIKSISGKGDYFSRCMYNSWDKQSEVRSFKDCKERELGIQNQEKCDLTDYSLRKAQVRLDFREKHESEKLKSLLSPSKKTEYLGGLKGLDWMFQHSPASPAQQDQVVNMMHSSEITDQDVDFHVQPPNILRDSGFQGSNAPTEEPQGKITDQENMREFNDTYLGGSEDSHTEIIGGPVLGDDGEEKVAEEVDTAEEEEAAVEHERAEEEESHIVEEVNVKGDVLSVIDNHVQVETAEEEIEHIVEDVNVEGDVLSVIGNHVQVETAEEEIEHIVEDVNVEGDVLSVIGEVQGALEQPLDPPADHVQGQSPVHNFEGDYRDIHGSNPHKVDFPPTNRQYPENIYDANSLTCDGLIESDDEDSQLSHIDSNINGNDNEEQNYQAAAEPLPTVGAVALNMFGNRSRSTLEGIPAELTGNARGIHVGLIDTEGAQARPTQDAQIRPIQGVHEAGSIQDTQARETNVLRGSCHEGHMTSEIFEAGHQELLLQQSIRNVTGGNTNLAKQFLSHLKTDRLLSQHCGVIVCRALQTVVERGEGGRFTTGHGGQYIVVSEEGRGGYGIVHLCEAVIVNGHQLESVKFARKRMPIWRFNVQEAGLYIDYGQRLRWMLDLKGIVRDGDNVDLFLQYAPGGSLAKWIQKSPDLQIVDSIGQNIIYNQIHGIVYQLLRCTSDLNRLKTAHWDIKAWNVLFTTEDCQGSSAVLIDTGTAKVWTDLQHNGIRHLDGTLIFFPPEIEEVCVFVEDFLDLELVDAWNIGATIYHVLTGRHLWFEKKQEFRMKYGQKNWKKPMRDYILSEGWRVCELINRIDQSQHPLVTPLVLVMSQLLEYDACLRRTATEVLDLPVFLEMRQQQIPSCAAGMGEPQVGDGAITIPHCRAGKSRRFPENPYAKVVVFYKNTTIYLDHFERRQGLHLQNLPDNAKFRNQLELHVPNFEDGCSYNLSCHTRDRVSGELVLMNVGTIYQDTYVYLTINM
ncbi:uncharacterized protein LOC110462669 [Mizuhopecten yessoensis]|uniref:Mitogen-activated protein kinase kinase kinase 3 n=1 Tax=Mizuhopecten yessoensis TaxID=6573 RepID=A0A210PXV3_MIZYE|nr:uncharacterized protein LOC110462669 [Mizuhopecten yessoensis]OWF41304.1 Mitogen-activated protein kinase kinase kinase 3 [Mizuhopecten yessoensis]